MGTTDTIENPILFFDGVCNLCNSSINFVIKRDKKNYFKFSSLQSDNAKKMLPEEFRDESDLQSIVLLKDGKLYQKSTAALMVAKELSGLWPILFAFMLIPKFIRDAVYGLIARNRYKWFGKKDQCMLPSPEMKLKFID